MNFQRPMDMSEVKKRLYLDSVKWIAHYDNSTWQTAADIAALATVALVGFTFCVPCDVVVKDVLDLRARL